MVKIERIFKLLVLSAFIFLFSAAGLLAQHDHSGHKKNSGNNNADTLKSKHHSEMKMSSEANPYIENKGSGTSWLPFSAPMNGYMSDMGNWKLMFHGNVFLRYNSQDLTEKGVRGSDQFDAPNWFMLMAGNSLSRSNYLRFSIMLSLDPLLVGGSGYPLLFQSGETWQGKALVDRQHPHDLISELSAELIHSFNRDFALNAYLGYSGEPAFGPVAFMHRPSALNNPDSPLGHHWQDATHITFGVATLGFRFFDYKIEGSFFSGREPNENRYNFDKPDLNSYSMRLSANPWRETAFQVSYAFIKSPESLYPDEDIKRTTASILYSVPLSPVNQFNSAVIWGFNYTDPEHKEHSVTLESDMRFNRLALYGRYEWIEKSAEELALENFEHGRIFPINALTLGVNYRVISVSGLDFMAGVQGSYFTTADALETIYGNNPLSAEIYLRVTPSLMDMNMHMH